MSQAYGYPQQPYAQPPYAQPPYAQPPKKRSGCCLALLIVGVVLLVVAAICGYLIYSNPTIRTFFSVFGSGVETLRDAQNAPGTKEMRAAGCDQALVIDVDRVKKLMNEITDAGATNLPEEGLPEKIIMCQMASNRAAPSCDAMAKAFFAAAPKPRRSVSVMVQRKDGGKVECSKLYSPDGTALGEFDSSKAPALPGVE